MRKPETMCDELGCTREWAVVVKQYGLSDTAPQGSTEQDLKLCAPCAEKRELKAAISAR
jgi:hypothetical protein